MSVSLATYQSEGALWLTSRYTALLADEMRLGKSAQMITAADVIKASPVLVVCPAVARVNWQREWERWGPGTSTQIIRGRDSFSTARVLICSYEYLTENANKIAKLLASSTRSLIIADECHYAKEPLSQRSFALYGRAGQAAARIWCASGTPAPSHAAELWTMLRTFGATDLSYDAFVTTFCTYYEDPYDHRGGLIPTGTADIAGVRALLEPVMLRRTLKQVRPDVPDIKFEDFFVESSLLPSEILKRYFADSEQVKFAENMKRELGEWGAADEKKMGALFSATPTLRKWIGASKVEAVAERVLSELKNQEYDRIVIWAFHHVVLEELRRRLSVFAPSVLIGGMSDAKRQHQIDRFNERQTAVFIGQYVAGGTAIPLPCEEVMFAEYDWVPGTNMQAAKRSQVVAAGETFPVHARFAVLEGSVDDRVMAVARRRTRELSGVFDES